MTIFQIPGAQTLRTKTPIGMSAVLLIGLTQLGTVVGASLGNAWLFTISAVLGVLVDVVTYQLVAIRTLMGRAHIGIVARSLIRDIGLIVLFAHHLGTALWPFATIALAGFAVPMLRGSVLFLDTPLERRFRRPVRAINVDLAHLPVEPRHVPIPQVTTTVLMGLVPLVGGCLSALTGTWAFFWVAVGLYAAAVGGWTLWGVWALLRSRRVSPRATYLRRVADAVNAGRPEALMYFSGPADSVYQLNMWLPVLERLGHNVVVLLREQGNVERVAPTTLPIVVIPKATDLMSFRLPTVRVAFYAAHVGKNIHLQREPRMKHVFIGHGESDKVASVNPITKGFDEIWVAGRVSRQRWADAKVGIHDDTIVEVGRPQLGGIRQAEPRGDRPLSVLYAPTWEGWTNDPAASSVPAMGRDLVAWLLERPGTRVIYKPHPFTGSVTTRAGHANDAIIAAIRGHRSGVAPTGPLTEDDWDRLAASNLVIQDPAISLYDCFNHADVLIGDISSVVPDFLASGKPYAIPNPAGRPHDELRAELASTRAAYLLDPQPDGWEAALHAAEGADPLSAVRAQLRLDLLGPYYEDPIEPWRVALSDLIDRANAEWPDAVEEAGRALEG